MSYRWQNIIAGATNYLTDGTGTAGGSAVVRGSATTNLTLAGISAEDLGTYQLVAAANGTGYNLASSNAVLPVVSNDPTITLQPTSAIANYGSGVTSSASPSTSEGSLSYRWYFDSTLLSNGLQSDGSLVNGSSGTVSSSSLATTLTLSNVTYLEDGNYSVWVSNNVNHAVSSSPSTLTVHDPIIVTAPDSSDLLVANELHHEGHPGWTTLMMLANIDANDGNPAGKGGYWLAPGNGVNPDHILVNIGGNDAAYWTGKVGGIWNALNGGSSNWAMDNARSQDRGATLNDPATLQYGIYPDVFFNSNTGALFTTLGTDTTIRSLNFTKGASGSVTIGAGNSLTIGTVDKSVTLSIPHTLMNCGGITVQAGSGAHTLAEDIVLGANQTWANVSTNDFNVSGSVSGSYILTISGALTLYQPGIYTPNPTKTMYASYTTLVTNYFGSGAIILSGNSSYTGGTFVNNGTLVVSGQSAPNSGTGTGPVTIEAGGTLSGNGRIAGSVAVANASNALLYPNIQGGGVLTIGGNLVFSGACSGAMFNLSADGNTGNDKVVLENKTLTCSGAQITIRNTSPSGLSASDYVLFDAGPSGTVSGNFNSKPAWSGTPPEHSAQYVILTVGNKVVLHYYPIEVAQIGITNGGVVAIKLLGVPNNTYVVQTTTNLTTPWWPVSTNIAGIDGSWLVEDATAAQNHQRFYRIVSP